MDLNQLLVLPNEFLSVPAQVAEVFLCGVRPAEMDHDWCEEVKIENQWHVQLLKSCKYSTGS